MYFKKKYEIKMMHNIKNTYLDEKITEKRHKYFISSDWEIGQILSLSYFINYVMVHDPYASILDR